MQFVSSDQQEMRSRVDSVLDSHIRVHGSEDIVHFLPSFLLNATLIALKKNFWLEGPGRISLSGRTQDIKMRSGAFKCDIWQQWIEQPQIRSVSVYCDSVGFMSCVCSMALKRGNTLVKVPLLQAGTVTIYDLRFFKAMLRPNKQTNQQDIQLQVLISLKDIYMYR